MTFNRCSLIWIAAVLTFSCVAQAQVVPRGPQPPGQATAKTNASDEPIATGDSPVAKQLRQWWEAGEAAGNVGDFYDNRDRGHSHLNLKQHPQLAKIQYSEAERKQRKDWAFFPAIRRQVVIGNSSTSAKWQVGGSNPRRAYAAPGGINLLYLQYRNNNLYIYPAHHDYGRGGNEADLFLTNTPYVVISRGSSGSDRSFMTAAAYTFAAFRPDVKRKLAETGLLMPTFQMILRSTGTHLKGEHDYFTAKAHPTIFTGSHVDHMAMVEKAHGITLDAIPPLAQLRMIDEEVGERGVDFFEQGDRSEKLADTPGCIARILRGPARVRKYVVSAGSSADVNRRSLEYRWVVLRGDEDRITIQPRKADDSIVEITVERHGRRPVPGEGNVVTDRVDLALFVHNGEYWSAPAFLTFTTIPNEVRTYEGDRLLEIGYGKGTPGVTVNNPARLAQQLNEAGDDPPADVRWLLKILGDDAEGSAATAIRQREEATQALGNVEEQRDQAKQDRDRARQAVSASREKLKAAERAHENNPSASTETTLALAAKQLREAEALAKEKDKKARELSRKVGKLREQRKGSMNSLAQPVARRLKDAVDNVMFAPQHTDLIADLLDSADASQRKQYQALRDRLAGFGILLNPDAMTFEYRSIRGADKPFAEVATDYEKLLVRRFNADLIATLVTPGALQATFDEVYVDPMLTSKKRWRDVYHHNEAGEITGWTRYDGTTPTEFNANGRRR